MTKQRYSSITTCGVIILCCALLLTPLPAAYSQDDAQPESSSQEQEEQEQVDEEQEEDDRELTQAEKKALRRDPCLKPPHPKGKFHGRRRECLPEGSSGGIAKADFNGDGFGDLAIGVPFEDVGDMTNAGAVNVLYGSAAGLSATGNQFWTQDSPGVLDSAEAGDLFGSTLAAGDFNNDGFSDLAIGMPRENVGSINNAGAVNVLYGSAAGLAATDDQFWTQDSSGVLDDAEQVDQFGSALVWADFNNDGFGDLAIGVPFEDVGSIEDAGGVNVLYGSANGLSATNDQFWTQDSTEVLNQVEAFDHFGPALTAGDFNGDSFFDLAIGVPFEDVEDISNAGAVNVLYGSVTGLAATSNQFWTQDSLRIFDSAEVGDLFGRSLAAGDFDGDGFSDLAIGVPFEDVEDISNAGAVNVLYGSTNRLSVTGNQFWTQDSPGIFDAAEDEDRFGSALAVGDFNGDGKKDLAIGVFLEDIFIAFSRTNILDAGAVNVLYGSPVGLTEAGNQFWSQESVGILDNAEQEDRFGFSLTAWDFGNGAQADLAIGVPNEGIGTLLFAGAVNVLYGSADRLNPINNQLWTQDSPDVLDDAEPDEQFGRALY